MCIRIYITVLNQFFLSHYSFILARWEVLTSARLSSSRACNYHVGNDYDNVIRVHPRKLTWNLKISTWKRRNIDKPPLFGFHVSFRGCTYSNLVCIPVRFSYISTWASGTGMSCLHQPVRPNEGENSLVGIPPEASQPKSKGAMIEFFCFL